jgi:integrase
VLTWEAVVGIRLTDKIVDELPIPAKGSKFHRDAPDKHGRDWVPGFGAVITSTGHRGFAFEDRNAAGRQYRITIGSRPAWATVAARKEAAALKFRTDRGEDPAAERVAARRAETVSQLCDQFLADHAAGKRSERDYKSIVAELRREIGTLKVAAVTKQDIQRVHRKITQRGKPYRANRTRSIASIMFNYAIDNEMRADNPCRGVKPNPEEPRKRYLTAAEHSRLMTVLAGYRNQSTADIFRLALFTGCRIGEAMRATWVQFDEENFTQWTKPASTTKQKKEHSIPLSAPAQQLLMRVHRTSNGRPTVFPAVHQSWLREQWVEICKTAEIHALRIHDLRHSFASTLANEKVPLQVVGQLLGHSKIATTERYSHLYQDVLRQATELAGKVLSKPAVVKGGRP